MNNQGINQIFDKFKQLHVQVIGDVMVDSYLWGKVDRVSPEAPVPVVSVLTRENRLGGAGNVLLNIKALGATPYLFSVTGADDTLISIASLAMASGLGIKTMALMANLAGGLVCEKAGVVPVNKNQLINEMKSQKI